MTTAKGGETPVKRGRGRPPLPRMPLEELSAEQLFDAMAEADAIAASRTMEQMIAVRERSGLHPLAFSTARKLAKKPPGEAQAFYFALGKYLAALGLLDHG